MSNYGFITTDGLESSPGKLFKDDLNISSEVITFSNTYLFDILSTVVEESNTYDELIENIQKPYMLYPLLEAFGFDLPTLIQDTNDELIIKLSETIKFTNPLAIWYPGAEDKYKKIVNTSIKAGFAFGLIAGGNFLTGFGVSSIVGILLSMKQNGIFNIKAHLRILVKIITAPCGRGHKYYYYHTQQLSSPNNEWLPDPVATAAMTAIHTGNSIPSQVRTDVISGIANDVRKAYLYTKHRCPEMLLNWRLANIQTDDYNNANENPMGLTQVKYDALQEFTRDVLNEQREFRILQCSFGLSIYNEKAQEYYQNLTNTGIFANEPFYNYCLVPLKHFPLKFQDGKSEKDLPNGVVIGYNRDNQKVYCLLNNPSFNIGTVVYTESSEDAEGNFEFYGVEVLPFAYRDITESQGYSYLVSTNGYELINQIEDIEQIYTESEVLYELQLPTDGEEVLVKEISGDILEVLYGNIHNAFIDPDNLELISNEEFMIYWLQWIQIAISQYGNKQFKYKIYRKVSNIDGDEYTVSTRVELYICEFDKVEYVWFTETEESHPNIRLNLKAAIVKCNPYTDPSYVNFNTLYVTNTSTNADWYYQPYTVTPIKDRRTERAYSNKSGSIGNAQYVRANHAISSAMARQNKSDNDTSAVGTIFESRQSKKDERTNTHLEHSKNARIASNPDIYARDILPSYSMKGSASSFKRHLEYYHEHLYGEPWVNHFDMTQQEGYDQIYDIYKIPTLPLVSEIDAVNVYWYEFWKNIYLKWGKRTYDAVEAAVNTFPDNCAYSTHITKLPLYDMNFTTKWESNFISGFRFAFMKRFKIRVETFRKTKNKRQLCDVFLCKEIPLHAMRGKTFKKYVLNPPEIEVKRLMATTKAGKQYPYDYAENIDIQNPSFFSPEEAAEISNYSEGGSHVVIGNPNYYAMSYAQFGYICFAKDLGDGWADCIGVAGLCTYTNGAWGNEESAIVHPGATFHQSVRTVYSRGLEYIKKRAIGTSIIVRNISYYSAEFVNTTTDDNSIGIVFVNAKETFVQNKYSEQSILDTVIYNGNGYTLTLQKVLDDLNITLKNNSTHGYYLDTNDYNSIIEYIQNAITENVRNIQRCVVSIKYYNSGTKTINFGGTKTSSCTTEGIHNVGITITLIIDSVRDRPYHESEVSLLEPYTQEFVNGNNYTRIQYRDSWLIPIDYNTLKRMSGLWVARLQPRIGTHVIWTYQYQKKLRKWVGITVKIVGFIITVVITYFTGGIGASLGVVLEGLGNLALNILINLVINIAVTMIIKGLIKVLGLKNTILLILIIVIAMLVSNSFDFGALTTATADAATSASTHVAVNAMEASTQASINASISIAEQATEQAVTSMVLESATVVTTQSITQTIQNAFTNALTNLINNPIQLLEKTLNIAQNEQMKMLNADYEKLKIEMEEENEKYQQALAELKDASDSLNESGGQYDMKAVMAAMVKHRFNPLTADELVSYCLDVSDQECKYDYLSMYAERKLTIDPKYFNAIDNIAI